MRIILLILIVTFCNACAFMVAKETVKAVDVLLKDSPNPEKKKKNIRKQKEETK